MKHVSETPGSMAVLLAGCLLVVGCGQGADEATSQAASDPGLFMACAESRGSLLEMRGMLDGHKRVDTSTLEHGAGMLGRLADRVQASNEVRAHIGRWSGAVAAWLDDLRAMQPRIEGGRVIEPDTSVLDRQLIQELEVVSEPLAEWVDDTCEGARL